MKKKVLLAAALGFIVTTGLTSCGDSGFNDTTGIKVENGKIGIILPGTVGKEMTNFVNRWKELGQEYGIEVIDRNFQGFDPAYYGTIANELIAAGANAIICNFEMDGKETVIEKCIDERVYIAYSGSTVSDEIFEEYKQYPYFLGQISPSPKTEEEESYKMTKYFLDMYYGENKVDFPEGTSDKFAVWPVDFHGINMDHQMTYRWKGIEKALKDYGVTISGHEDADAFKWSVSYTNESPLKDKLLILGNNLADQTLNARVMADLKQNPNTIVITSSANYLLDKFAGFNVFNKGTRFATIDTFNEDLIKWYKANPDTSVPGAYQVEHNPYILAKYIACNTPVFDLCYKAFTGNPIRDAEGNAINIEQRYWLATNHDEFKLASELSKEFKWGKEDLANITTEAQLQDLFDKTTLESVKEQLGK